MIKTIMAAALIGGIGGSLMCQLQHNALAFDQPPLQDKEQPCSPLNSTSCKEGGFIIIQPQFNVDDATTIQQTNIGVEMRCYEPEIRFVVENGKPVLRLKCGQ